MPIRLHFRRISSKMAYFLKALEKPTMLISHQCESIAAVFSRSLQISTKPEMNAHISLKL